MQVSKTDAAGPGGELDAIRTTTLHTKVS